LGRRDGRQGGTPAARRGGRGGSGENGEEARAWATSDLGVHWGLGDLGKWPAGGERERGGELTAAVAMAARCDGMARGGGTAGFYRWLGGPWVTAA
jgi:hypothetical protein